MGSFSKKLKRKKFLANNQNRQQLKKVHQRTKADIAMSLVQQEIADRQLQMEAIQNTVIIFSTALHERFKFGKSRLEKTFANVLDCYECVDQGYATFEDFLQAVAEDCIIDLHRSKAVQQQIQQGGRDYVIQSDIVDHLSTTLLLTMYDKFGFRHQRLDTVYHTCVEISQEISHGKRQLSEMQQRLKEVGFDFSIVHKIAHLQIRWFKKEQRKKATRRSCHERIHSQISESAAPAVS